MSIAAPTCAEPPAADPAEPEPPVTVIGPRSGWAALDPRELWRFRELLAFLVWRDVKIRYKQTAVGAAWAVLQPVAVMAALTVALGRVVGEPGAATPYWLFALCGLVPWTFFAAAVGQAGASVVNNGHLVTKVYFPRLLLPLSAVGLGAADFLVGFAVLLVAAAVVGPGFGWNLLVVPVAVGVLALLAVGLGVLTAALTVRFRDFRVIVPLVLQLWLFLTPAVYDQRGAVGADAPLLAWLNPVNAPVAGVRAGVLGGPVPWAGLGLAALAGATLTAAGGWYFRKVERGFADVI